MTNFTYSNESIALQRRFETEALAQAELGGLVHAQLTEDDTAFISGMDMFWLASVDARGAPTVSYKGGPRGFVTIVDARTLVFPCYDGNGMFHSMGNICATGQIGMLFMSFEVPARLRVHGRATLVHDTGIMAHWPGAQFAIRVDIDSLITNCPRYIPRMQRQEGSRYLPDPHTGQQPFAGWKRIDVLQQVLPPRDQSKAATEGGLITGEQWREMVKHGNPQA